MKALTAADRPRIAGRCAWQSVEGEAVIIDLETRKAIGLNRTGSLVWTRMDGERTVAQLGGDVAAAFGVDQGKAHADVVAFLQPLVERGLVELA